MGFSGLSSYPVRQQAEQGPTDSPEYIHTQSWAVRLYCPAQNFECNISSPRLHVLFTRKVLRADGPIAQTVMSPSSRDDTILSPGYDKLY